MSKPKIHLSEKLQETIAYLQESNCDAARARVAAIDAWMTVLLSGHSIQGDTAEDKLILLQALNDIKLDYQSLIIE